MTPIRGTIEGTIELSKFRSLYDLANAEITIDGIPRSSLGLELDGASELFRLRCLCVLIKILDLILFALNY